MFFKRKRYESEEKFRKACDRWDREWGKSEKRESTKEEALSWLRLYYSESEHRFALLQRRRRLMEMQPMESAKEGGEKQETQEQPPEYRAATGPGPSESQRRREIDDLAEAFWERNRMLLMKIMTRPDIPEVKRAMILNGNQDRHGRSFFWCLSRAACADSGGCCGRACQCCEKPLITYYRSEGCWKEKELTGVYGHCTAECPCCIKYRRRYHPDPRLPDSAFKDVGTPVEEANCASGDEDKTMCLG